MGLIYEQHPECRLVIVGEESLHATLTGQISSSFERASACTIGPFTKNLDNVLIQTQIFVLSSVFEGLPMVMIEAMCYGIPSVSFNCETGPREIIEDNVNGFLESDRDINELCIKTSDLNSHNALSEAFSNHCLRNRAKFNVRTIMKDWTNMLQL